MYYYPENMAAKPMLWLWELRDIAIIGVTLIIAVFALIRTGFMLPLVAAALYAFLSIRVDSVCILDFIRYASAFFFLKPQSCEWRPRYEEE